MPAVSYMKLTSNKWSRNIGCWCELQAKAKQVMNTVKQYQVVWRRDWCHLMQEYVMHLRLL